MAIDSVQVQIKALSDEDFHALLGWMRGDELSRRDAAPLVQEAQAELVQELQDAGKLSAPEAAHVDEQGKVQGSVPAWVDPGTDHAKMYKPGDVIRHSGKVYRSMHPWLNPWEPGGVGVDDRVWMEITPKPADGEVTVVVPDEVNSGGVKPFVQPTGGHDAYNIGNKVLFNGVVYESVINGNAFSPSAYPQGWKRVP